MVLLQAKVAGANETLQAHTYGEVRALDNKKNTPGLVGPGPLDRREVFVSFFGSFKRWRCRFGFRSRPKTSSPLKPTIFYLYGLRR